VLQYVTAGATVVVATHSAALAAACDTVPAIEDGVLHDITPERVR
jgi:ABC-type lipoprotein export system ATPase subunit